MDSEFECSEFEPRLYSDPECNYSAWKPAVEKWTDFFSAKSTPRSNGISEKKMDKAEEMEIILSQDFSQSSSSCQSCQSQTKVAKSEIGSDAFR